jgi:hypothetical protein
MRRLLLHIVLISVCWLFSLKVSAEEKKLAIIAAKNFPKEHLTVEQVRAIYLGETQILGSIRVYPIDQSHDQAIRETFLLIVLNMNRDLYLDYWNKRLYRKGGITPLLEYDGREVLIAVGRREGAIGYVWEDEIRDREDLKILISIEIP